MLVTEFVPARFLASPHAQTIAAHLLRRREGPSVRRERWRTPDDDFVDVDLLDAPPGAPTVLLLHGLEGSSRAGYVVACLRLCAVRRWGAIALNFRGCSGVANRWARSYCMADWTDVLFALGRIASGPRFAIGFSLGGNVLLQLLAERPDHAGITAAVAVSVPFDVAPCAHALDGPGLMMRVYQQRFLRSLKAKALDKARRFPDQLDAERIRRCRGIVEFDECVTAPLYGLGSAAAYYAWSSTGPKLGHIRTPTLLISSLDDPLAPASLLPHVDNPLVSRISTAKGGHCGFVGRGLEFFAETEAFRFLDARILKGVPCTTESLSSRS